MNGYNYLQVLLQAAPEAILSLAVLSLLFLDLTIMRGAERRYRRRVAAAVFAVGCLGGLLWTLQVEASGRLAEGVLTGDALARVGRQGLLGLALLALLVTLDADFTPHVGEYYALFGLATVGMLLMVGAENLLMVFVAMELTSLSLYAITALNKLNPRSTEAALKYFLFGSIAAAFALFGFSLLYGVAGTLDLRALAPALAQHAGDPLTTVALILVVTGLGFKIAAVPFHLWAPDVYQGAPSASAAWIASGSKVAGFLLLARLLIVGFSGSEGAAAWSMPTIGWAPLLAALSVGSMTLGNLAALAQGSVKRLIAYSAIAHAGYALVGLLAADAQGTAALVYYVLTYGIATLGTFGVLALVEDPQGDTSLERLRGLAKRNPWVAGCLLVYVLSLAGIPPLAGFFGKFYLFAAALTSTAGGIGLIWLVALAIGLSAVSLYYYLQILKQAWVAEPAEDRPPLEPGRTVSTGLGLAALLLVVLGCAPDLIVGRVLQALRLAGW